MIKHNWNEFGIIKSHKRFLLINSVNIKLASDPSKKNGRIVKKRVHKKIVQVFQPYTKSSNFGDREDFWRINQNFDLFIFLDVGHLVFEAAQTDLLEFKNKQSQIYFT